MATLTGTFEIQRDPKYFEYNKGDRQESGVSLWVKDSEGKWLTALVGFDIPEVWKRLQKGDVIDVEAKPGARKDKNGAWATQYVIQNIEGIEDEDEETETPDAKIPF